MVVVAGSLFCVIFHVGTREERVSQSSSDSDETSRLVSLKSDRSPIAWREWFKEPQFYQIALLYMSTRLVVNVSQVYLPMYVSGSLQLSKRYIAVAPLCMFLASFIASLLVTPIDRLAGRKVTYLLGVVCVVAAYVWMWFIETHLQQVLGAAFLLGTGCSIMLVMSLSLTADLIGDHSVTSNLHNYSSLTYNLF